MCLVTNINLQQLIFTAEICCITMSGWNDTMNDSACCFSQHCSVNTVSEMISNVKAFLWSGDGVEFEMETNALCLNAQDAVLSGFKAQLQPWASVWPDHKSLCACLIGSCVTYRGLFLDFVSFGSLAWSYTEPRQAMISKMKSVLGK